MIIRTDDAPASTLLTRFNFGKPRRNYFHIYTAHHWIYITSESFCGKEFTLKNVVLHAGVEKVCRGTQSACGHHERSESDSVKMIISADGLNCLCWRRRGPGGTHLKGKNYTPG